MNYQFNPGFGIDNISFSLDEERVVELLGAPSFAEKDVYEKGVEETKRLFYRDLGIMVTFSMYDKEKDPLKIFSDKLFFDDKDLYRLGRNSCKNHLKKYHEDHGIDFELEETTDKDELMDFYPNIGLTLWYMDSRLIDACVEEPEK